MSFNIKEFAQRMDAKYVFPRPANANYMSSYKLFLRLLSDFGKAAVSLVFGFLSIGLVFYTWSYMLNALELSIFEGLGRSLTVGGIVMICVVFIAFVSDVTGLYAPYRIELQRESHGSQYWARPLDLTTKDADLLRDNDFDVAGQGIFLAPFRNQQIFLSLRRLAQSIAIFGPPGSGKSSTFFIPAIRQFYSSGGVLALDVKGEIFEYTSHYSKNVYRLDIQNPHNSDWFDLFGGCQRNPDLARRIASYIVGYDPNKVKSSDPIWEESSVNLITLLILYLCEIKEYPVPADIESFLAKNPKTKVMINPETGKKEVFSPLTEAFEACPYKAVGEAWNANFADLAETTYTSIKMNLTTKLAQLKSPKITEVMRKPTKEEERLGRRRINFDDLRKKHKGKGAGIYFVISPSDAVNLDGFVRLFFSYGADKLRESKGTNVMIALDEAGNVPLAKLSEGINTDRSKGICYFLGYQDVKQPYSQYGADKAESFLGTVGTNIFLPGIADKTAEFASNRVGETTILQRSSADAENDGYDHEKLQEAGRKLMKPADFTEMPWFVQCVISIKGLLPIKTKVPPDSKEMDTRQTQPKVRIPEVTEEVQRMLGEFKEKPKAKTKIISQEFGHAIAKENKKIRGDDDLEKKSVGRKMELNESESQEVELNESQNTKLNENSLEENQFDVQKMLGEFNENQVDEDELLGDEFGDTLFNEKNEETDKTNESVEM